MSIQQNKWLVQEFELCHSLMQQTLGALHRNRLKRAEKLVEEAVKVAERLKQWQSNLPAEESNSEIATAVVELHKAVLDRRNFLRELRNPNALAEQNMT